MKDLHPRRAHRFRRPADRRRPAFTLVELLVVIAIISMLISMLTPSLSRARQQAKATVCLATMNELMKGLIAYTSDYGFKLPPARYNAREAADGQPVAQHGWAEALYRDLYHDDDFSWTQDFPVQRNREDRFKLWVCKEADPQADSTGHYRVYELSWSTGSIDAVKHRWPLIIDANPQVAVAQAFDLEDDYYRSDVPLEHIAGLEGEAFIDERHYAAANYAYNDGHVERSATLKERLALDWDLDGEPQDR